jgi:hypothetical protein
MGGHPVLAAALLVVALVVGGCSSGAQGAPEPDGGTQPSVTSSAPSATPSSTAQATMDDVALSRIPKAARAHTPQGAEAFARFYLEQVNKAWMAPDPELIRPYALESCKTCANYLKTAEWLLERTLRYNGSPMTLGVSIVAPESRKDHMFVEMPANQEHRKILRSDGSVEETLPKRLAGAQVELEWNSGAWRIIEVRVIL